MGKLYLAYGSNLNLRQMKYRCPNSKIYGKAELNGYRLIFHGSAGNAHASIERKKGRKIPVLIWDVPAEDEASLDIYEGYPKYYFKENVKAHMENDEVITAMAYIMDTSRKVNLPSKMYIDTIAEGYADCDFDIEVLDRALAENRNELKRGKRNFHICPKCDSFYTEYPAISRIDGTEICPTCGMREALDAYLDYLDDVKA